MAKIETTAREVRKASRWLIMLGYDDYQKLVNQPGISADCYTHGVYGWNFDVYWGDPYGAPTATLIWGDRGIGKFAPDGVRKRFCRLADALHARQEKGQTKWDTKVRQNQKLLARYIKAVVDEWLPKEDK